MHLSQYLAARGAKARFAEELGISAGTVTDICNDKIWPTRETWARILKATKGCVSPADHLNSPAPMEDNANGEGRT